MSVKLLKMWDPIIHLLTILVFLWFILDLFCPKFISVIAVMFTTFLCSDKKKKKSLVSFTFYLQVLLIEKSTFFKSTFNL
jgi:hypothetical protein